MEGMSDVLREVTVPIMSVEDCQEYYDTNTVTQKNLCIETTGGKGTCHVSKYFLHYLIVKTIKYSENSI